MTIVAGPNGSGKTRIVGRAVSVEVVNADEIARTLPRADAKAAGFEARMLATQRVERLLTERTSFGVETTLNLEDDQRLLRRAQAAGFTVELLVIWSGSLEASLNRIALRVEDGTGHHVPADEVRQRYERAVEALAPMLGAADSATVFDNSRPILEGIETMLEAKAGVVVRVADRPPDWLRSAFVRWRAPLSLHADLTALGADPRSYFAQRLIEERRRK